MRSIELIAVLNDALNEQGKILKLSSISDVVRRDCALLILQSIVDFLRSWPTEARTELPNGLIREGLELVLSELGPGDKHLRMVILDTIRKTSHGRQQMLDILPFSMPLDEDDREMATELILDVFRDILIDDCTSLLPIIGSLSSLALSNQGRQEAWKLALVSLDGSDPDGFPIVVQSLLRNVTGKIDAVQALERIRSTIVGDVTLIGNIVVAALQQISNGILLCDAYMEMLGNINSAHLKLGLKRDDDCSFVRLDLLMLLELYRRPQYKSKIESLLDEMLLSSSFPFDEVLGLPSMLRSREPSLLQDILPPTLLELGLFLILSPIRLPSADTSFIIAQTHLFMLELHRRFGRTRQEELVRSLLHLGDEVAAVLTLGRKRRRGREGYGERIRVTCQALHRILLALAVDDPASIIRSKILFIERLTSEKRRSGYKEVCAIIVSLTDGDLGGGIDTSELMILLQKLLFCSTGMRREGAQQQNASMIARGILLATSMVKSHALNANDKDCIYEWVLKILLPSNRRTVQPAVGSNGLDFLSIWASQQRGSSVAVFEHVKMIMANTGLVQLKEGYLERKRRDVDLAYNDIPLCFVGQANKNGKRKKRNLLFCISTFLQFRGLTSPVGWAGEVNWVFTLVNTYLQLGRNDSSRAKRSKWLPDGWLEAGIELPILPLSNHGNSDDATVSSLNRYAVGNAFQNSSQHDRLRTALLRDKDFSSRKRYSENVLQLVLALLLSLGLSIAVLRNSLDHFNGLADKENSTNGASDNRQLEVLNLLKYQLLKIYDLQDRIRFLLTIVESLAIAKGCRGKNGSAESDLWLQKKVLLQAASHGHEILSNLMNISPSLDVDFIKICLIDEADSDLLFKKPAAVNGIRDRLAMIVLLRLKILEHSVSAYHRHKIAAFLMPYTLEQLCLDLSVFLPMTKMKSKKSVQDVPQYVVNAAQLSSSYLEYIICTLDHIIHGSAASTGDGVDCVLESLLRSRKRRKGEQTVAVALFDQFREDLEGLTEPSLALQVVEILSLIAGLDPVNLGKRALNVCWRMIHTIYSSKITAARTGISLLFSRISMQFLGIHYRMYQSTKVLRASIVKSASSQKKDFIAHQEIRRSLLILWSLLVQPLAASRQEACLLSSLVDDIETYIQISKKEVEKGIKKKSISKPATNVLPSIPTLNGGTLYTYVEMTMHMIISTFAVMDPARGQNGKNPFLHLTEYPRLLGRLITVTEPNVPIFPKGFMPLLITCCHHMLELTVCKTEACVEWRNLQPLLTDAERHAGVSDSASIPFLEEFLQDIRVVSCGTVASVCIRVRDRVDKSSELYSHKVAALLLATERTANKLQSIALAHNIVPANNAFEGKTGRDPIDISKVDVYGFHHKMGDDDHSDRSASKQKKQRMITPVNRDETIVEPDAEYEWEADDRQSSQGFGATGVWGSDDSDLESVASTSLELEGWRVTS